MIKCNSCGKGIEDGEEICRWCGVVQTLDETNAEDNLNVEASESLGSSKKSNMILIGVVISIILLVVISVIAITSGGNKKTSESKEVESASVDNNTSTEAITETTTELTTETTTETTTSIQDAIIGTYYSDYKSYENEKVIIEKDQIIVDTNLWEAHCTSRGSYTIDGNKIICGGLYSEGDCLVFNPGLCFYFDESANKLIVYNGEACFCLMGWGTPDYLYEKCTFTKG